MKFRNKTKNYGRNVYGTFQPKMNRTEKVLSCMSVGMFLLTMTILNGMNSMPFLDTANEGKSPAKTTTIKFGDFRQSMNGVFRDGLGGDGAKGIGIAIMVIGIIAAVISFAVHKFNPQSRMPGWITCLAIGIVGGVLVGGVGDETEGLVKLFADLAKEVKSWFGV